ncbi:hypothetical protein ETAA8_05020 [Anatilimnocola aggregata]|uniref:Uncharacterized protein n=1 Tax=Anatilimnocola aggregata TaxID=2528021 RepID=A0A517Y5B3_9BACT|nr:hypothetical protein ETAA8_05020 [Anatilimnocola aggregata]
MRWNGFVLQFKDLAVGLRWIMKELLECLATHVAASWQSIEHPLNVLDFLKKFYLFYNRHHVTNIESDQIRYGNPRQIWYSCANLSRINRSY